MNLFHDSDFSLDAVHESFFLPHLQRVNEGAGAHWDSDGSGIDVVGVAVRVGVHGDTYADLVFVLVLLLV